MNRGRVAVLGLFLTGYLALSFAQSPSADTLPQSPDTTSTAAAKEATAEAAKPAATAPTTAAQTTPVTTAMKPAATATAPTAAKPAAAKSKTPVPATESDKAALVDYEADVMTNRGDDIIRLVGNVHFHHNGAIIQCDSAFRYDANRMDFFGHVIVEQDSTYIYGDRVNYDGRTAIADVFAPVVKTMRGDVRLYTYNMSFSTKSSIGTFSGGGVVTQTDKLMESYRGEYNANTNTVKFLDSVSLRSDSYIIRTDSLSYNLDAEQATFLARTYIWDHDRDFLLAQSGDYFARTSTYVFTSDAYAMTPDNELWADTMSYVTPVKQAIMVQNVQILDTANSTVAFGDWGFYDDSLGRAVLTDTPSMRSWEDSDTSYMRADTIRMLSFEPGTSKLEQNEDVGMESAEDLAQAAMMPDTTKLLDTTKHIAAQDSLRHRTDSLTGKIDSLPAEKIDSLPVGKIDSLPPPLDRVAADSLPPKIDSLPVGKIDSLPPPLDRVAADSLPVGKIDSLPTEKIDSLSTVKIDSLPAEKIEPERERVIRAYHKVRMWAQDYQGVCDSMVSFSVDSTSIMYGKPVLWSDNNQLTAEQIDVYSKNEQIDWVDFTGDPFITQQIAPNDTLQYNQANGKRLRAYFKDNELDYAWLTGNVMNFYYMDEQQEIVAMAVISCAELTILFTDREPSRMIWGGAGEGPIFPIEKVPPTQERFLTGFSWQENIRPKSASEICSRIPKPSFRTQAEQFYKPSFGINAAMEQRKADLKAMEMWSDRTDTPDVTPQHFLSRDLLF